MRWLLSLWFAPITFLILWMTLASHDWSLGIHFFSRDMYDTVFGVYANLLGVPAESLPPLVARALVLDSLIVLALFAFRQRKAIKTWMSERYVRRSASIESLSKAP